MKSEFNKNVLKLFSSSSLVTIISFLTLPILTRLYETDDFGNFQLLISIITLFSVISALKFEMAIVLPDKDDEANRVIFVSFFAILVTTFLLSLIFFFFGEYILSLLNAQLLQPYVYLIITGILFSGLILVVRMILVRNKNFGVYSTNNIIQGSINQILSITFGVFKPSFIGLFISYVSGLIAGVFLILRKYKLNFSGIALSELRDVILKYKKFPLINAPMVFLNTLSLQLPIFMLAFYFEASIVGVYMLAHRISSKPLNLIGNSFAQVYYKEANDALIKGKNHLLNVYKGTVKKLTLIGLVLIIGLVFIVPNFIGIIFGQNWTEAGYFIQIISFWIFFQFINSPISKTLTILNKQEIGFILIIISIITRFLSMYLFNDSPTEMLWGLSISAGVFYIVFNIAIYLTIKNYKKGEIV